jgi:hypothetical protein
LAGVGPGVVAGEVDVFSAEPGEMLEQFLDIRMFGGFYCMVEVDGVPIDEDRVGFQLDSADREALGGPGGMHAVVGGAGNGEVADDWWYSIRLGSRAMVMAVPVRVVR